MAAARSPGLTVGTRWYLLTEIINGVASVVGVMIFTRLVPPAVYGTYAVVMAGAGIGLSLTAEWLQFATMRLLPGVRRPENYRGFLAALVLLAGAGVAVCTVAALAGMLVWDGGSHRVDVLVGWAYVLSGVVFMGTTTVFQARLRPVPFALLRSAAAILRIVCGYGLLAWRGPSGAALVGGNVLALAVLIPFALATLRGGRADGRRVRVWLKRVLAFGGPMVGWFLASQVLNVSDRFLIGAFGTRADVGQYAVTYALVASAITAMLQPVLAAAFPAVVRTLEREGEQAAGAQLARVVRLFLLLAPPLLTGLVVFGPEVIGILAAESYRTPRLLVSTLALGVLIWNFALYVQKYVELRLDSRALLRALAAAAVVNVLANLFLVPWLGIQGAALATVAGYGCYVAGVLRLSGRPRGGGILYRATLSLVLAVPVMVGLMLAGRWLLADLSDVVRVAAGGGLGVAGYAGVLRLRSEWGGGSAGEVT